MQVVHGPDGAARVLAREVETADSVLEQARGLMGRSSIPDDYALVFRFEDPPWWTIDRIEERRFIHMLFVRAPIDVLWIEDGRVKRVETLRPWLGFGSARADTVIELPAGAADGVEEGDRVVVEDGGG